MDRNFRVNENFEELPLVAYNFIQEDKIRQLKIVNLPTKVDPKIKLTASREKFKTTSSARVLKDSQVFYRLRQRCLDSGKLFEDPDFPASVESLFFSQQAESHLKWLRPKDICKDPQFFVGGFSRFDVQQGELGDCWFLAAVSNLTQNQHLFKQVVYDDNSFVENYAGVFHFRFWRFGKWVDVVVDDRLPTFRGQLMYLHSANKNEFWSALLEKAYAKLHGSYEALNGGTTCEALEDFTGGVAEFYDLKQVPSNLFEIIIKGFERDSMMACSINADPNEKEAKTPEGLICGHAYSITRAAIIDTVTRHKTEFVELLRMRSPWGNEVEWNGAFSDNSSEWRRVPEATKIEHGISFKQDGEFWILYQDFLKHFDRFEICNLSPDSLSDDTCATKKWNINVFEGEWVAGVTAGGCRNNIETFHQNPQYIMTLEDCRNDGKCTVLVALMQKYRRSQRSFGEKFLLIGFSIYSLSEQDLEQKPLKTEFFKYNASVARSLAFVNMREVSCRFELPPGQYLIVPSTFEPNEEAEFLIRVFTESKNKFEENDKKVGIGKIDSRICPADKNEITEKAIEKIFNEIAGPGQEIGWMKLKQILDHMMRNVAGFQEFSKDICRSMVAMLDADFSGKLCFEQFKTLLLDIAQWKAVFKLYDRESTNTLNSCELRDALASAGYHLNNHVLNSLAHRYGTSENTILFDDFISCAIKLKTMIERFKEKDFNNNNEATFTIDEWIIKALYS